MPSTWAGTSDSQLLTRGAIDDAANNGYLQLKAAITDPTRIATKSYIESVVNSINTSVSSWSALASLRCPTKLQLKYALTHNIQFYTNGSFKLKIVKNSTTLIDYSPNNASCTLDYTATDILYNDTITVTIYTALYSAVQGKVYKGTGGNCGTGTTTCTPISFTNFQNDLRTFSLSCVLTTPVIPCL